MTDAGTGATLDESVLTATRIEIDGAVATVWLHRPHRHNAWTGRMHGEYRRILAHLDARPDVRVVVVTGTPPAFCVGGDADALQGHVERGAYDGGVADDVPLPGYGVRSEWDADFAFQFALRVPVIAAVNGATAGVGLALAMFCDLRYGAANAKCTTAAPKLGLPAEYGMSWQLPRLVGVTRAADLLLTGRVFTPAATESWGLWNGVAADGEDALAMAYETAPPGDRRRPRSPSPNARSTPICCTTIRRRRSVRHASAGRGDDHRGVPRGRRRPPSETAPRFWRVRHVTADTATPRLGRPPTEQRRKGASHHDHRGRPVPITASRAAATPTARCRAPSHPCAVCRASSSPASAVGAGAVHAAAAAACGADRARAP
ncbi:MAG: enoyl-CoA hydratase-related protein [Ilumatobacteraceae bacterium]